MFEVKIWNNKLVFSADETLFSPHSADRGTIAMLKTIELKPEDKLLDLGCGYGLVGIAAAKVIGENMVYMVDNNPKAVEAARSNAVKNAVHGIKIICGDGVSAFSDNDFSLILSNPPYHTDFSVAKAFIEQGYKHLRTGGRMVMVVKRLDWYKNKMAAVFGGVRVSEDDGYYILASEKRAQTARPQKEKKTTSKHLKKILKSAGKHK